MTMRPAADIVADKARLNSVRGLACLLLVINHSVGGAIEVIGHSNMVMTTLFQEAFAPIRMPLFSILSGFIYAVRPVEPGTWRSFVGKKVWRIVIPCLVITALLILSKNLIGRKEDCSLDCALPYIYLPYEHLWFLQAIFCIFLMVGLVDSFTADARRPAALAMMAITCIAFFTPLRDVAFYSIGQALYLAPFFVAGIIVYRFRAEITAQIGRIVPVLLAIATLFLAWHVARLVQGIPTGRRSLIVLMLGLSGCNLLLLLFPRISLLTRIGAYSYTIYLFHTIFASLANRLTDNLYLLSVASVVLGLLGPIVIEICIKRYMPVFGFVIGVRPRRLWSGRRPSAAPDGIAAER